MLSGGKTKRREIGEFLFNQMGGKLGELAFRKFLHDRFGIEARVSFEVEKELPGQDIFEAAGRTPKIKVSIKTTKIQNFNLWVNEEEIDLSDAYVLCRVDLPSDHLFRVLREHEKLSAIREIIPELSEVEAEVVGFAWRNELKAKGATMEMVGADGEVVQELRRPQYVMLSGEPRKSRYRVPEWKVQVYRDEGKKVLFGPYACPECQEDRLKIRIDAKTEEAYAICDCGLKHVFKYVRSHQPVDYYNELLDELRH